MLHRVAPAVILVCASLGALPAFTQQGVPPDQFEALHKLIKPSPGESPWSEMPWLINVAEARQKAAAEGKLLLLWHAGGGHPLGFS